MHNFKTILTKLKEILSRNTKGKVLDKDIAAALNIKPATLASYKNRNKPPFQAILSYCHENRLDVLRYCLMKMNLLSAILRKNL